MGVVKGLTSLGEMLVSGCEKYLIRIWDYESEKYPEVKCEDTLTAFQSTYSLS